MTSLEQNLVIDGPEGRTISAEANSATPPRAGLERMARRRFQNPKPFRSGSWWYIQVRRDEFSNGKLTRKNVWPKLAPATMPDREVRKVAAELLRPLNQGLENIGSATNFSHYVENTFIPIALCKMAKSTQHRYAGVIKNYLKPAFGKLMLRDLTPMTVDRYFAGLAGSELSQESLDKIRDVLASVITRAIRHGLLVKNPMEGLELPRAKHVTPRAKPFIYPEQFEKLLRLIPEPYASAVYVAVFTGLRVSELAALKWGDIHEDSITIDERFCRGDWGAPKSDASNATIGVNRAVIERMHRLKLLTVEVKAGRAIRKYRVVKSDGPDDLVFQGVKDGRPIRDNLILSRYLKPAGRKLGLPFVNWRCLRTSHATWLKMAGADPKDIQGQMRHSRIATTMEIYTQFVPESQRRAVDKLTGLATTTVQ